MTNVGVWPTFGIAALVLLNIYWRGRNAVWGGCAIGIAVGFLVALYCVLQKNGFDWSFPGKGAVMGTIAGFASDLLGRVSGKMRE